MISYEEEWEACHRAPANRTGGVPMTHTAASREFPEGSLLVVGNAQVAGDNPISHRYNGFFITFILDPEGLVLECSSSVVLPLTDRFIRDLFVGRSLARDESGILAEIEARYHGSSRKAIVVCYKDALKKFREIKRGPFKT